MVDSFDYNYDKDNRLVTIFDLPLGKYLRKSSAMPVEAFPGKYYVNSEIQDYYGYMVTLQKITAKD